MIDYEYEESFLNDTPDKQLHIYYQGGHLTNADLYKESFTLQESLCSQNQLKFGTCEASVVTFKVANVFESMVGKVIRIEHVLDGHTDKPFVYGFYRVASDKPDADRRSRTITAYDQLYEINNEPMDEFVSALPNTLTIKALRDKFFEYFGLDQEEVELPNDNITVSKPTGKNISGKAIITAICELNGCFGHINRNGDFRYVFLGNIKAGLYPANDLYPDDDLYPVEEAIDRVIYKRHYLKAQYEDIEVQKIDKIAIVRTNTMVASYGTGNNLYKITNNILANNLSSTEAQKVLQNVYYKFNNAWYIPCTASLIGNPCLEVGNGIRLVTSDKIIYTYILKRNMTGIKAVMDKITANGTEYRTDNLNNVQAQVNNISNRTDVISNGLDSTNSNLSGVANRVSRIEADYIVTSQLEASNARIGNLEADHVSVSSFNAVSATVNTIKANYITASYITSDLINTKLSAADKIIVNGRNYNPITFSYAGKNYYILAADRNY